MINSGRVVQLIIFVTFAAYYYYAMRAFIATGRFSMRPLRAVQTMEEAVGRATEMGRPIHWTFGAGTMNGQIFAGFNLLGYTARLCAKYETRLLVSIRLPEIVPMCEEIVRRAYVDEGRPDAFRPEDLRFWGTSHNPAMIGLIAREKPAGNFIIGNLFHESVLALEAGALVGAIQVGGTMNTHQLPFIAAGSDAIFIGAEMFAASAHISRNPVMVGTVMAEELIKKTSVVLMVIGILAATAGNTDLVTLLQR